MDLRDPMFQKGFIVATVETIVNPTCSISLGEAGTRHKIMDGSMVAVPPCSDCNSRDIDCGPRCPDEEWCESHCCYGCDFKAECNEDVGIEPEPDEGITVKRSALDISALAIEEIDNGWIMSYANEDGEDHQQYFKDTESICKFLTEQLRRP